MQLITEQLKTQFQKAQHLAILTGAGVSAESGIPTFRDALTGLWENYNAEQMASEKGFLEDSDLVWGWYQWRRQKILQSRPNPAHLIIAQLASILPKVTVITQNVDDLHERAGSHDVLHLHGSIHKAHCIQCHAPYHYPEMESVDPHLQEQRIAPPKCEPCGGLIRPGVVWFGELLPMDIFLTAESAIEDCDFFLIVGTSGIVYPAADLPYLAIKRGVPSIQINSTQTHLDRKVSCNLKGSAGILLTELYEATFRTTHVA
jgi:NAD-dependent deacetylase